MMQKAARRQTIGLSKRAERRRVKRQLNDWRLNMLPNPIPDLEFRLYRRLNRLCGGANSGLVIEVPMARQYKSHLGFKTMVPTFKIKNLRDHGAIRRLIDYATDTLAHQDQRQ